MLAAYVMSIALMGQVSARGEVVPPRPAPVVVDNGRDRLIAKRRAKKLAIAREVQAQEVGRKIEAAREQKAAEDYAWRILPYQLELNRQALERQSALERNEALHRLATAAQGSAQAQWWGAGALYLRRP
jgi:hypothetical protein